MKKIMFSDKFCQTDAVLAGTKTQMRTLVPAKLLSRYGHNKFNDRSTDLIHDAPFKVGEVVAVAQSYNTTYQFFRQNNDKVCEVMIGRFGQFHKGWTNKMFVEAMFMPHQIEITNIRVQRLQDISDQDCLSEGIISKWGAYEYLLGPNRCAGYSTPQKAYSSLINNMCGKGTWESNPWVFCYTFKLVK